MEKRNFTKLKKIMILEELNKFCKKIAEEYANWEPQFARTYFCERYQITVSCFYKILEYAIVENLVDDITVQKMIKKAMANQNLHKSGAGYSSVIKYARMWTKRSKNTDKSTQYKEIAEKMTVEEIKILARDFGDNPDITKADFASAYGVNVKVIDYALEIAIKNNIANDREVEAIKKRSINNAKSENVQSVKKYFSNLRKIRKANQKEITLK